MIAGITSRRRNLWFRALGVHMNGYVWMRNVSIPRQWCDVTIEKGVGLDDGVVLLCSGLGRRDKLVIRSGTYVNRYTMFDVHESLEVGRHCMIGPHCYLTDSDHGILQDGPMAGEPMVSKPTIIEDNVWLGAGVIVLKGVRIGRNAVVGAGAVVTKDVPAKMIVAGVPAREIGRYVSNL